MPRSRPESETIAAELDAAWLEHRAIAPPLELARLSLTQAYDVQDAVVSRREQGGTTGCGWKLGLTSRVKQRLMGIDRPLFGRTFCDDSIASGSCVSHAAFIAPRAEPELAFGLAATLDPAAGAALLLRAIAWIAPALEITDSRYLAGTRSAVELVADNTSAAAYVLGERIPLVAAERLDAIETEIVRNGTVLASGSTADVLGNPLNALRLLAAHLAARGLSAAAGDVVLSGAITDAFPALPGDYFEARLRGLNTVAVQFV